MCLRPSFSEYQCFRPPGHTQASTFLCLHIHIHIVSVYNRERIVCTYGATFVHLQFDPQGGPGAPLVPAVLLQASFRQAVQQLPSSAAALWICFHQHIVHLFIYCLSKGIVC